MAILQGTRILILFELFWQGQKQKSQLINNQLAFNEFQLLLSDRVRIKTISEDAYPTKVSKELVIIGILLRHLQIKSKLVKKNGMPYRFLFFSLWPLFSDLPTLFLLTSNIKFLSCSHLLFINFQILKQFYGTYQPFSKLSALLTKISWTNHKYQICFNG